MLQAMGCDVEVATDGARALAKVGEGAIDLVLMDLHMPDMDGFDATRAIRAEERTKGRAPVPIVALSASVLPEDQEKCLEVGMNGHLPKPISQKALEELLRGISPRA
jgi:CheY-like chemotaxis protein